MPPVSPTVQVFGVPGVRAPGCVDQYGLDLHHPHPVSLHPPLQHLPGENPLALLRHRPLHPRHIQMRALCVLAGKRCILEIVMIILIAQNKYLSFCVFCFCWRRLIL